MFPKDTKILVCDDMEDMQNIFRSNLKILGYQNVHFALDGQLGWEEIEKSIQEGAPFQLILCDWNMDSHPGIELLKKVKASDSTKTVPFIMITSKSRKKDVDLAKENGTNGFLTKPFTTEELKEALEKVAS